MKINGARNFLLFTFQIIVDTSIYVVYLPDYVCHTSVLLFNFQIINGASVDPTLKGFGFSLGGGKDLDNNKHAGMLGCCYNK